MTTSGPMPMGLARRDGTLLRLWVRGGTRRMEDCGDDAIWETVGCCFFDLNGDEYWHVLGWNWEQDCLSSSESGEVVAWDLLHSVERREWWDESFFVRNDGDYVEHAWPETRFRPIRKLVRDRCDELHPDDEYSLARNKEELTRLLCAKLREESQEIADRPDVPEEYGDLLDTAQALMALHSVSWLQVLGSQAQKNAMRGGFSRGLIWEIEPKGDGPKAVVAVTEPGERGTVMSMARGQEVEVLVTVPPEGEAEWPRATFWQKATVVMDDTAGRAFCAAEHGSASTAWWLRYRNLGVDWRFPE